MDLFKKKKRALGQAVGGIVNQITHEEDPEMKAAMRYDEDEKTPISKGGDAYYPARPGEIEAKRQREQSNRKFEPNTPSENEEDRLRDLQRRRNALQRKSY